MMPLSDWIPITFMGGTGGHFLTALLMKAKNADFSDVHLSQHGNAHGNPQDCDVTLGIPNSDIEKINRLINVDCSNKTKPYFTALHLKDIELGKQYFNKIIRITYAESDIPKLCKVFLLKNLVDEKYRKYPLNAFQIRYDFLKKNQYLFKVCNDDRVLCVTWNELYEQDITKLFEKLSKFTKIPIQNFNLESVVKWRDITSIGLNSINTYIGT